MTRQLTCAVAAILVAAAPAAAQSLGSRIEAAPPGHVQFSFAARPGVCGNGRTYIQAAPNSFTGSFTGSVSETMRADPCEPGPVRVVLDRAGREIIAIDTYVGPVQPLASGSDLGRVRAQDAADYLLQLAARAEGRVGRAALFPATLADSADILDGLISVARNQALPRETRTSALSHVGRASERVSTVPASVTETLVGVARDESDNITVRRQALSVLGRLEHGAGIPTLVELTRQTSSLWLAREAMNVLASSGDPRARQYLRSAVQRTDLPEDALAIAIRSLGQHYATLQDAQLLRSLYPRLNSAKTKDAVLSAVGEVGGSENVKWLLDIARSEQQTSAHQRRALEAAGRAGARVAELVGLYDAVTDYQVKDALISLLSRAGERAATDKLIAISQNETNVNLRRRAIAALSQHDDPKVKEALKGLIVK